MCNEDRHVPSWKQNAMGYTQRYDVGCLGYINGCHSLLRPLLQTLLEEVNLHPYYYYWISCPSHCRWRYHGLEKKLGYV